MKKVENVDNPHQISERQTKALQIEIDSFPKSEVDKIGRTNLLTHTHDKNDDEPVKQRHHPVSPYIQKEKKTNVENVEPGRYRIIH